MTTAPDVPAARPLVPKLVVTDLDGTFLSPDGSVSEANSAAVLRAQVAGLPVLFATGRPVRWLDVIRDLPGAHPTVIASNGAVLYDLGARVILDSICIDAGVALDAVATLRRSVPGTTFGFESGTRFGYEPGYHIWADDDGSVPWLYRGTAEEIARTEPFVKLLVQNAAVPPDELAERAREVVGNALTVTHSAAQDHGLVEVSAPGVSKASMLQRVCATLGVTSDEVAAFGDMPNDLEMLNWVGLPHVVANAHPQLLDLGYPVVPANVDSGVGRAIHSFLDRRGGPGPADAGESEQREAEPGKADPDKADPDKADPGKADPGKADRGKADPGEVVGESDPDRRRSDRVVATGVAGD